MMKSYKSEPMLGGKSNHLLTKKTGARNLKQFLFTAVMIFMMGFTQNVFAQNAAISPGNIVACNTTIYDRGGSGGNYANSTNEWITIAGRPGATITISGSYALETCCDKIYIRNGYGNAGAALVTLSTGTSTTYTGTAGQTLTVHLTSDFSNVASGFAFTVTYSVAQTCPTTYSLSGTATSVACGSNYIVKDNAGDNTSYGNGRNDYMVFNSAAGSSSVLNINGKYATESGYDYLRVYQGAGTGGSVVYGPLSGAGTFNFTGSPGVTYTLQFTSDGSSVDVGYSLDAYYSGTCATCTKPTTQATIGNYSAVGQTTSTVNWTRGTGNKVLVVGRLTSATSTDPTSGTAYTANAVYGSGTQIGTGNFVVYDGTGTSVNVTGLTANAKYSFTVYEYNTTGVCYLTPGSGSDFKYGVTFGTINTGSVTWCAGETRTVSVQVTNSGNMPWTSTSDNNVNFSYWWTTTQGNDANTRITPFSNLAPGSSQTINFTITAPAAGSNTALNFDVVKEGECWYRTNGVSCGPGNNVGSQTGLTINTPPTSPNAGADVTICAGASTNLSGSATGPSVTTTGSQTFNYSGSGYDCDNFRIGATTSGMPTGATITSIVFNPTIGPKCTSWYEWDLIVNNNYIVSGCNATGVIYNGLNGAAANGQLLQLRSWNNDFNFWGDPYCDAVNMSVSFTVNYTYTAPAPISYTWTPAGTLNNAAIANPIASPTTTTDYTMTATSNGCSVTDVVRVNVKSAAANVALATATVTPTEQCSESGWTYYADPSDATKWLFGIYKNGNTFSPTVSINVKSASPIEYDSKEDAPNFKACFTMGRYWNINPGTITGTNLMKIRFFAKASDIVTMQDSANAWALANPCTIPGYTTKVGPWEWFKTVNTAYNPSSMTAVGTHTGSDSLLKFTANYGTLNGVEYMQYEGITSFSGGTVGIQVYPVPSGAPGVPLPVKMTSFTAKAVEDKFIQLDWSTAIEIDNKEFLVGRGTNGKAFKIIGKVSGNGTTTKVQKYVFEDHTALSNVMYYYQLEQVDYDGKIDFSNIVSATFGSRLPKDAVSISLFPNPVSSFETPQLVLYGYQNKEVKITVSNLLGQKISSQTILITQNKFIADVLIPEGSGTYMVHVESGLETRSIKLITIK